MSQLFQGLFSKADSRMPVSDGLVRIQSPPDGVKNGIPFEGGSVAIDTVTAISHYHQGIPFTSEGRIAAAINNTTRRIEPGGAPYNDAGRLSLNDISAVDRVTAGVSYTALEQIAVNIS